MGLWGFCGGVVWVWLLFRWLYQLYWMDVTAFSFSRGLYGVSGELLWLLNNSSRTIVAFERQGKHVMRTISEID